MDSQSITPVGSQPSGQQVQNHPQTGPAGEATVAQPIKAAPAEVEVRTRDPRTLHYQVDGSTQQVVAKIVDESNQVVVVQIPDAEILRIAMAIDRMKGFLLEGKA